mgnify:CR=1 FL=1
MRVIAPRPRVTRFMRKANIKSIIRKKYRVQTTASNHGSRPAPNILGRDFYAEYVGQKWGSDLTYIRTAGSWLYLTTMIDLTNRKIEGWALTETMGPNRLVVQLSMWR